MFTLNKLSELRYLKQFFKSDQIHNSVKWKLIKLIFQCLLNTIYIWQIACLYLNLDI